MVNKCFSEALESYCWVCVDVVVFGVFVVVVIVGVVNVVVVALIVVTDHNKCLFWALTGGVYKVIFLANPTAVLRLRLCCVVVGVVTILGPET